MDNGLIAPSRSGIFAPLLGATVLILAILTLLAGLPPAEQMGSFVVGVVVLIAVLTGIGLLGWHLLLRPLPAHVKPVEQPSLLTARARSIIALLLTLGTLSIGIAGIWDEIWHSKYGIPFGEDFFWRPHLMLYFAFLSLIAVGGWSWWTMMSRGKGTLQQRFRANPLMGISFLAGLFTIYAVGADPIWHRLYGADIAPWSLPHLMILVLILFMAILTITYHKTLMPPRDWGVKFSLHWRDVLIALAVVGALVDYLLIFTVQFYAAAGGTAGERQLAQIANYPDWLFAVFLTFLACLFGMVALHATRQIGMATLAGVLAILVRFVLDTSLGSVRPGTQPLFIIVPLLLAMDIWYAIALRRGQRPPPVWTTALVVAVVFGVVGLPIMASIFPHPPVNASTIPGMLIASLVTALGSIWFGRMLGDMNGGGDTATRSEASNPSPAWVSAGMYVVYAVFLVVFVATAAPPV